MESDTNRREAITGRGVMRTSRRSCRCAHVHNRPSPSTRRPSSRGRCRHRSDKTAREHAPARDRGVGGTLGCPRPMRDRGRSGPAPAVPGEIGPVEALDESRCSSRRPRKPAPTGARSPSPRAATRARRGSADTADTRRRARDRGGRPTWTHTDGGPRRSRRPPAADHHSSPSAYGRVRTSAPGRIRTSDTQDRSLVLYPAELRARGGASNTAPGPRKARTVGRVAGSPAHGRHAGCAVQASSTWASRTVMLSLPPASLAASTRAAHAPSRRFFLPSTSARISSSSSMSLRPSEHIK